MAAGTLSPWAMWRYWLYWADAAELQRLERLRQHPRAGLSPVPVALITPTGRPAWASEGDGNAPPTPRLIEVSKNKEASP